MAVINIDDVYILDETGAEVDKVTGLFTKNENATTGEKQMARLNIAAGGSNDNLLDNAYFVGGGSQLGYGIFPINQRGQTSYGGGATTNVDRWWTQYDTATTLTSAGMRITGKWDVDQRLPQVLPSGTYTFSVNVVSLGSTGAVLQFLDENYQQLASAPLNNAGITSFTLTSDRIRGVGVNLAKSDGSGDITFASMKLEKGTVSTLANDAPPKFRAELANCQQYLYGLTFPGYAYTGQICFALDAQNINWNLTTPVPMVQNRLPSISVTNSLYANGVAISGITIVNYPYGNNIKISGQAGGMTNGQLYPITTSANEVKVLISTEL